MPREIDSLIERGLTLYGQGDLEDAMVAWEQALAIEPDHPQARSYLEYTRANYEVLAAQSTRATSQGAPFGIADDEPEYQIEIQPGEIKPGTPKRARSVEEGWPISADPQHNGTRDADLPGRPLQEMTMEADEPPSDATQPDGPRAQVREDFPPRAKRTSEAGMEFDDATREYDKQPQARTEEFGPDRTPGFGQAHDFQTPPGFSSQATGIKQRDLGFVQPKPASATALGLPERPRPPAPAAAPAPPVAPASSMEELTLELAELHLVEDDDEDKHEITQRATTSPDDFDELDLISSLPSPRPAPQVARIEIDTPLSGALDRAVPDGAPEVANAQGGTKSTTRDFPPHTRAPAFATAKTKDLEAAALMGSAPTEDFEPKTQVRDHAFDQTQDIPNMAQAAHALQLEHPVVSAPTRDLGLREQNVHRAPTVPSRNIGDGTRADVMLSFDPIDARASEIIEEIDEAAPRDEPREDKTRRRISALFERAAAWGLDGDLERAVAAVDLALSEDPNSALAQKLIHRNRETIMSVFQAYLGDLERQPQLARPLHELANAQISPRAAFLLSRIDGLLTTDEILDVCGMPRLEAYRYLCQLFLRGILR